ncbi:MAG: hypothetical protein KGO05_12985 [Chloroflexota bacterium]|nr:hypothetical protein [Chloroflexota bacterium]
MAVVSRLLEDREFETDEEANAFLQSLYANGPLEVPPPETPLQEAQELVYQALQTTGARRVALAKRALSVSPDCADAYVLLAENESDARKARDYYRQGVDAGARALGAKYFEEAAGEFWGLVETRPYMRARQGLAMTLWSMGEREAAITHASDLLRLNPGDNQGIRYLLASWLLSVGDQTALTALLANYPDEISANWAYTRVLLTFRESGAGRKAEQALKKALDANPHVPLYLLGLATPPKQMPGYYGFGDENEALIYVVEAARSWMEMPESLDWLAQTTLRMLLKERAKRASQARFSPKPKTKPKAAKRVWTPPTPKPR